MFWAFNNFTRLETEDTEQISLMLLRVLCEQLFFPIIKATKVYILI